MYEGVLRWLNGQGLAAQSISPLTPKAARWPRFLQAQGVTTIAWAVPWSTGDARTDNLLSLCLLQAKPFKTKEDRLRIHELRNLIGTIRPYSD